MQLNATLTASNPICVILKLDFTNAFNCIRQDKILSQVTDLVPQPFPFVHSAYGTPYTLYWGATLLQTAEGVQQGDPLGAFLFCLAIHPLTEQLISKFIVFYLDDGTIGGRAEDVIRDLHTVECAAREVGLQLNRGKSEVTGCGPASLEPLQATYSPELKVTSRSGAPAEQATLLGSALGGAEPVFESIQEKTKMLKVMVGRLQHLNTHDILLFLVTGGFVGELVTYIHLC